MADAAAAPQSAIYSVPESVVLAATPSALPNNLSECSCDPKVGVATASNVAVLLRAVGTFTDSVCGGIDERGGPG